MSQHNGRAQSFVGPARAKWMAELKDFIDVLATDHSLTEAAARRVYGDDFRPPEPEDTQLAGGDIKYEVHNHLPDVAVPPPRPVQRPKSPAGIVGAATILAIAILVAAWLVIGRPMPSPPVPTPTPIPAAVPTPPSSSRASDYIEFYKP